MLQDNLQIMRDLSLLQIQMRDYEGYRVSIGHTVCACQGVPRFLQSDKWMPIVGLFHATSFIQPHQIQLKSCRVRIQHQELVLYLELVMSCLFEAWFYLIPNSYPSFGIVM